MSRAFPASFYRSRELFERTRRSVFPRAWHLALDALDVPPGTARPFRLHEGFLDEPLLALSGDGGPRFLSNVCTHRAAQLVDEPTTAPTLRCFYHGRCFDHAGRVVAAPGFEELPDFPGRADHLPSPPSGEFAGLPFVSPDPDIPFDDMLRAWAPFVAGLGLGDAVADPDADRDFDVAAHWALYVDNYLEGLHVRFVHPALARSIGRYAVFPFPGGVLQVAGPPEGSDEAVLDLPDEHPFAENEIAAIYVWLFPATMINVYPWGVSLNVVTPLDLDRTRVCFRARVTRPDLRSTGAGGDLDRVEAEDESVVERVQRGIASRLYRGGRLLPGEEDGVLAFRRLLEDALASSAEDTDFGPTGPRIVS